MHKYVTTYNRELSIVPVSPILLQKVQIALKKEFESNGVSLDAPKYCVALPGSDNEQCYEYDEESIKDEKAPAEDVAAWEQYLANVGEFNGELTDKMFGVMIMDQDVEFDDSWEAKLEWLGLEIPENEYDKKVLFMTTVVLKVVDDINGYMQAIIGISMSGVSEDLAEAAKGMFSGKA